jgi:hypothetical protein
MRRLMLTLLLASAGFTARLDHLSWAPPPNRPGQSAWIPLHHQDQESDLCMPTSASMVLDYFGDSMSPREIKALTLRKEYKPGDIFKDFSGTSDDELVGGLARRGYHWRIKDYPLDAGGLQRGLAEIERSLDAGIPVLVDVAYSEGHTMVANGYSKPDGKLYFIDPDYPAPGIRFAAFEELDALWRPASADHRFRYRTAVFPKRKR